jgi:hypothetical protein
VEHAFDDLAARRWIEAKLRAGETLAATRKGMAQYADELDASYRDELAAALAAVENLLVVDGREAESGDAAELKRLLAELDETTKPLAEHMMNQVMEEMLRRQGVLKEG